MVGYLRCFGSNKTMFFRVSDRKLLKTYVKMWQKISSLVGKKIDSKPVYGDSDKYIKTKIKSYGGNVNTNLKKGKKYQRKLFHTNACHS